jgi:hypothetical protein
LYFTSDRATALQEWVRNPEEVKFNGIYDNEKDIHNYNFMEHENIQSMIDMAMSKGKGCDPLVWMVNVSKNTPLYINALPIQRKIMDVANMMVYKKHLYIMSLNPHAQLVRAKTELFGYINITHEAETDDYTWGGIKKEWTPPKPNNLLDETKLIRTTEYKLNEKDWKNHKLEVFDDDDVKSIIKQGGLVYGMAGTGKSTTLNQIKDALPEIARLIMAYTHKASIIVNGNTFHKVLGIDVKTRRPDLRLIKSYVRRGITHFLIDEISMIPLWSWNILSHLKKQHKCIFIGCGDWKQLTPPEEEDIEFENLQMVKELFNYNSYELCKVWRFSDNELLQDAYKASNGEAIDYTTYGGGDTELSLCHTNDAVDAINKFWNQRHAEVCDNKKEVIGFDNTKYIIYKRLNSNGLQSTDGQYIY